jgi:hypothetical protein
MKLQKAVRQETVAVAAGTGIGCIALILLFLIVYLIFPQSAVRFDYRVVLGALCGGAVAVANFFLMAVTVQNVVNVENRDDALRMMRVSYRNRMLMRGIWIIVAIFAPCFHYAAGIIPLFIPSLVIKIRGIRMGITGKPAQTAAGEKPGSSAEAGGAEDIASDAEAAAKDGSAGADADSGAGAGDDLTSADTGNGTETAGSGS